MLIIFSFCIFSSKAPTISNNNPTMTGSSSTYTLSTAIYEMKAVSASRFSAYSLLIHFIFRIFYSFVLSTPLNKARMHCSASNAEPNIIWCAFFASILSISMLSLRDSIDCFLFRKNFLLEGKSIANSIWKNFINYGIMLVIILYETYSLVELSSSQFIKLLVRNNKKFKRFAGI